MGVRVHVRTRMMIKKPLRRLVESVGRRLFDIYCDPVQAMRLDALGETVAYIKANARDALCLRTRDKLFDYALSRASGDGLVLEFGVHRGASLTYIARRLAPRPVYGFDSFRGNPEDWSGWDAPRGVFDRQGRRPKVPPNAHLVSGWFDDSLRAWLRDHHGEIAFVHVDCDLYSSTRCVFDHLGERIGRGTIIVFDEYFNYVNWQRHEYRAFQEFIAARGLEYRYLAYSTRQVAVEIL